MQPFGKLAVLLAALGVGTVPPVAAFESSWLIAQQIYVPPQRLIVPSVSTDALPKPSYKINSTNTKSEPNKKKKNKKTKINRKFPVTRFPIKPKPNYNKPPVTTSPVKPKSKPNYIKPSVTTFPIKPKPNYIKPPVTTFPIKPRPNYIKPPVTIFPASPAPTKRRRAYLPLRKPTISCRSFRSNQTLIRGFRARLYGSNTASIASGVRSRLNAYQRSGGNLSRCVYSGVISPSSFKKYFGNRKPTRLIRASDNYSLPVYSSYSDLFAASGGRRSRFGLIATTPSFSTSSGRRQMLKITVNNALIFFVDGRNQSVFNAPSSRLPVRLLSVSPRVSEVLSEASKTSLKRIVDFKKLRKSSGNRSSLSFYEKEAWRAIDLRPFSLKGLRRTGLVSGSDGTMIASRSPNLSQVFESQGLHLAEVDKQIAEYCMNAQDFSGCVETMQGSSEPAYPGVEDGNADYSEEDELGCPEGTVFDLSVDECVAEDEASYSEYDDFGDDEFAEGETDDYGEGELAQGEYGDEEFDDGSGMYPEDMGAPTAQTCTGDTFGEQLACALISALSTLLQQAFASN